VTFPDAIFHNGGNQPEVELEISKSGSLLSSVHNPTSLPRTGESVDILSSEVNDFLQLWCQKIIKLAIMKSEKQYCKQRTRKWIYKNQFKIVSISSITNKLMHEKENLQNDKKEATHEA
jgi:hypothetical protein